MSEPLTADEKYVVSLLNSTKYMRIARKTYGKVLDALVIKGVIECNGSEYKLKVRKK